MTDVENSKFDDSSRVQTVAVRYNYYICTSHWVHTESPYLLTSVFSTLIINNFLCYFSTHAGMFYI